MTDAQRDRIEAFLAARHSGARITRYATISGGYSRLMAEFDAVFDSEKRHLVWRGDPPADRQIIVTSRQKEFALLSALSRLSGDLAGTPRYFDPDGSELGTTSMILDYVEGEQLMTLLKRTDERLWPELTNATCALAAAIHSTDLDALPAEMERPHSWSEYLDTAIDQWRQLEREQVEPAPLLRYVTSWLDRNRPPEAPLSLVHGDFQSPNVLIELESKRARAIDWEFAHIGDPREDLGYFLALVALSPPDPTRGEPAELCRAYLAQSDLGDKLVNPLTVAYFSILPFGPMIRRLSAQIADLVAGRNRSLQTANLTVMVTAMVEGWVTLINRLENRAGATP
ncbi:aminoglycoside phosphotransferase [Mycolicibacterium rhodesiae JS60]|nr:aminoglycoside phosphotransferase [Mycolicibacterium rhodesiae JS60]